ncbi:MAG: class I SAM-dependent methyltransferase [Candidatus Verstraetearchaeota archaeon]|nr:class I SAM-dependent methyltransferase [Candidatus Verstraetearchaeota archaeon]
MVKRLRDNDIYESHYFSSSPAPPKRSFFIRANIRGQFLELISSSGVFSKDKVDLGTVVLIESLDLPERGEVLDMGCGYGVVGITIAKLCPRLKVTLVDVNPVAIKLVRENVERNSVQNAEVIRSDLYALLEGRLFDLIVSNPPLAAGYRTIFPMIEGAFDHLKEGGSLQIVLRKGINRIPAKMHEVFKNVETVSRKSGYRVFRSVRKYAPEKG